MINALRRFAVVHWRHIVEGIAGILVLMLIAWFLSFLTPYQAPRPQGEVAFYQASPSRESDTQAFRAKIMGEKDGKLDVLPLEGSLEGKRQLVDGALTKEVRVNDTILLFQDSTSTQPLIMFDYWRLPAVIFFILLFIIIIAIIGRRRGITSLVGLAASIFVIGAFIIPQIANGSSPFWTCIIGAYVIATSSILIAHGLTRRTIIALLIVLFILTLVVILAYVAVVATGLRGVSDDTTTYLNAMSTVDMRGVLIGGIVIATLGVLDDIVTAQVAVVDELRKSDKKMTIRTLYKKGASVGGEHIASLVNTLALVYVGVALPMILGLVLFQSQQVGWSPLLLLNSEFIAQEIVRTIVASIGLVVAVPVSTYGAAYLLTHWNRLSILARLPVR